MTEEMPLSDEQRRKRVLRGVVCTLVGGTFWGINGTASKLLMDAYARAGGMLALPCCCADNQ